MKSEIDAAARLLRTDDWAATVCNSSDLEAVREVLVRCAEIMLPYWEARFVRDESMSHLTAAMRRFSSNPTLETGGRLESLIPTNRLPHRWDLSPPPGFLPDDLGSDCPADFAGDAIAHAALALADSYESVHPAEVCSALSASIETIARLFGERDRDDDSDVDHYSNAKRYVRQKLLEIPGR